MGARIAGFRVKRPQQPSGLVSAFHEVAIIGAKEVIYRCDRSRDDQGEVEVEKR